MISMVTVAQDLIDTKYGSVVIRGMVTVQRGPRH